MQVVLSYLIHTVHASEIQGSISTYSGTNVLEGTVEKDTTTQTSQQFDTHQNTTPNNQEISHSRIFHIAIHSVQKNTKQTTALESHSLEGNLITTIQRSAIISSPALPSSTQLPEPVVINTYSPRTATIYKNINSPSNYIDLSSANNRFVFIIEIVIACIIIAIYALKSQNSLK